MEIRRADFGEVIASAEFILHGQDGTSRPARLRVGRPYELSSVEWACPVEILGFEPRYADAHGGTSLQALCLAIMLVRSRLEDFILKGGRILDVDGSHEWDAKSITAIFGTIGAA